MRRFGIHPFMFVLAIVICWLLAAGYRIGAQVPLPPQSPAFNFAFIFLAPAFMLLDYVRIYMGSRFAIAVATLAVITSYSVNSGAYSHDLNRALTITITAPLAVFVGSYAQRRMLDLPLWQLAVTTDIITNVTHTIVGTLITRGFHRETLPYMYVSITGKLVMFLFTMPLLIGLLRLTYTNVKETLYANERMVITEENY